MNLFDTVKAAVTPPHGGGAVRAADPARQHGLLSLPRRPYTQHEAERGLFLLLRLRDKRRCDRPCGKAVRPERL